jgi:hypothetical protein
VDEALVSELETAIADSGALLVRAQKYRRGAGGEGQALVREALAVGDAARRLHRADALDDPAARRLLAGARAISGRLSALIAAARAAPEYRAAVRAYAAGDAATLVRLLPTIFAGLEPVPRAADLFAPLAWLRRGRPRPVPEVVAEVDAARTDGLVAEGDDLSPGADAELPAVVLRAEPPPEEPIVLRVPAAALPGSVLCLAESGDHLVHVPRLRAPVAVRLSPGLDPDEQLRVEMPPAEYARHRDALARALAAAGIPVDGP